MTDIFFADLVRETSYSNGAEPFILEGASPGYRSFAEAVPQNRYFYYAISNINTPREWEVGRGYIDEDNRLIRDAITSSNNNDLTDFSDGLKIINLTISAQWFAEQDGDDVSVHSHDVTDINGIGAALDNKQDVGDYALTSHDHNMDEITGLSVALSGKQDVGDYAPNTHVHAYTDIDGLNDQLLAKQDAGDYADRDHSHNIGDIAGLENIYSSGNHVGISKSSPDTLLHVERSNHFKQAHFSAGYAGSDCYIGSVTSTTGSYIFDNGFYFSSHKYRATSPNRSGILMVGGQVHICADQSLTVGSNTIPTRVISIDNATVTPGSDNQIALGKSNARFSVIYSGSGAINTSDRKHKKNIGAISDEWLDAWADVKWSRYKFRKGGKRWHLGLIAQHVHQIFQKHNIDAFEIGLCCYDEWDDEYQDGVDQAGNDVAPLLIRKAGRKWGLRYDECFAMEAAYQRRELHRITEKLNMLSKA